MTDTTVKERLRDIAMGLMDVIDVMSMENVGAKEKARRMEGLCVSGATAQARKVDEELPVIGPGQTTSPEVAKILPAIVDRLRREVTAAENNRLHLRSLLERFPHDAIPVDSPAPLRALAEDPRPRLIVPDLVSLLDGLEASNEAVNEYLNLFEDLV